LNSINEKIGISEELTEDYEVEARIYNDEKYDWAIHIHPPVARKDIVYFKIYNNNTKGSIAQFASDKCARISMLSPEYIHCEDCSKNEWTLNNEEKEHLCEIVNSFWEILLTEYENELYSYDGKRRPEILKLQIPDYTKLKEEEEK